MPHIDARRRSFREGLLAGLACLAVAGSALVIVYREAHQGMVGEVRLRLEQIAAAGAAAMESEAHAAITEPGQMGSEAYRRAVLPLVLLREAVPELFYAYTAVVREEATVFVLDTSFYLKNAGDETAVAQVGEVYAEAPEELRRAWHAGRAVSCEEPYTDKWGTFLSGFAPFRDEAGNVAGIVGVDLSLDGFRSRLKPLQWALAAAALASVLGSTVAGVARYRSHLRRTLAAEALEKATARAEEAAREAQAANRAKGVFLATMSHEVRTPMNGVLGTAELLGETELTEQQKEQVKTIRQSAEALLAVLNDILDYSTIEAGAIRIRSAAMALGPCIEEVAQLFAAQAKAKGIELRVELGAGEARAVQADAGRLRQILANLVSNALKFTDRGVVTIATGEAGAGGARAVGITVVDTGIGIAPEMIDRLFRPFSQIDDGPTRREGGTGLGLAISRRLAVLMGGSLEVRSEPGVGSCFRLVLPWAELPQEPAVKPAPAAPAEGGPLKILVAEDVANNRRMAELLLRRLGHRPDFAKDGAEAVALWRELRPEVIFMDVHMPVMGGHEATRQIRAEAGGAGGPWIIALTAGALAEERDAALAAGMDDFITKPVTGKVLAAALDRARAGLAARGA